MTGPELAQFLRAAGLDEATATALTNNAQFQSQAAALTQRSEYDRLAANAAALEASHAKAKQYQEWYDRNYAAIQAQSQAVALYEERYGALTGQPTTQAQPTTQQQQQAPQFTAEQVKEIIRKEMEGTYGSQVTGSIIGTGKIVEMHMRNKRQSEIDWTKVQQIAAAKGGDVEAAYREWDAPEAEKANKLKQDAEVEARVKQELEKRLLAGGGSMFPSGAGYDTAGAPSPLIVQSSGAVAKAYDRNAVIEAANSVLMSPDFKSGFRGGN